MWPHRLLILSLLVALPRPVSARTVEQALAAIDAGAGGRVRAAFAAAGVAVPARQLWILAVKDERRLELYGRDAGGRRVRVAAWPILAASGGPGPKLRQGDLQVPEGIYRILSLNPDSSYHLSMHVGYPNGSDRARAARDGRTGLGGSIYIHGDAVSIGCIAIGDPGIEELFWAVAHARRTDAVIVPTDLRTHPAPAVARPAWVPELYQELREALEAFPARAR